MSNQLTPYQRTRIQSHLQTQSGYVHQTEAVAKQSWLSWLWELGLEWLATKCLELTWIGIKAHLQSLGIWFW